MKAIKDSAESFSKDGEYSAVSALDNLPRGFENLRLTFARRRRRSGSTAGAARSGAQLIKSNHLRLQFVRFGWLFIGIYDRFYKRRAGRAQGRLDRRPDFVRAFAMKSVGAASTSESDKIYRRKRAAILWISDFFSLEFHFGKTVIL